MVDPQVHFLTARGFELPFVRWICWSITPAVSARET